MGFFSGVGTALAGGALSLLGGERRNTAQADASERASEISAEQAVLNRQFQERMSNTAVGRRMTDLRRSGINPILASGSQASSPGGAMGQAFMPQINDTITPAVNTSLNALQTTAGVEKTEQEVRNLINEFDVQNQKQWLMEAQKMLADQTAKQQQASINIMREEVEIKAKQAQISEVQYNLLKEAIEILAESFPTLGDVIQ